MTKEGTMNLEQFHKKFGIKRIEFSKVRKSDRETQCESDALRCPYCESIIEYESENTEDILKGTPWQCPLCEKWFYAEGEASIDTWCKPMEDAVIEHRRYIEDAYNHVDKCLEHGLLFDDNRYGNVEWETYYNYAKPYFENLEQEAKE